MFLVPTRIVAAARSELLIRQPAEGRGTSRPRLAPTGVMHVAAGLALVAAMGPAHAVDGDTFSPYVSYTVTHEDNLLRLHNRAAALAVTGAEETSDTVTSATAGIKIDKAYQRQRVTVDLNASRNSYDRYRSLDNIGKSYSANWSWHAFDDLEGNLISTYSNALAPLEDFRSPNKVLRTQRFNFFEARYLVTPSWRVRGDISRYFLGYELDALRPYDLTLNSGIVGIDYLPATDSTFGLQAGRSNGGYPGAQGNATIANSGYLLDEFKGLAKWRFTPQTDFDFLGGWVRRKANTASAKDFSGVNARLTGNWSPTAKLNFSASAYREFAATGDQISNYTLNRGLNLTSAWDVTYKIRLEAAARTESRDYNGIATIVDTTAQARDDRFRSLRIASVYKPTSHLKVIAGLFRNVADSTVTLLAYRSNGAALDAQYEF